MVIELWPTFRLYMIKYYKLSVLTWCVQNLPTNPNVEFLLQLLTLMSTKSKGIVFKTSSS